MNTQHTAQWAIIAVVLLIIGSGIGGGDHAPLKTELQDNPRVEIVNWNWNKNRAGDIFVVHGRVRNKTDRPIRSVYLELRTEAGGKPLSINTFRVQNIDPNEVKPFREDIVRTGKEKMGYLTVKSVK